MGSQDALRLGDLEMQHVLPMTSNRRAGKINLAPEQALSSEVSEDREFTVGWGNECTGRTDLVQAAVAD